MKFSFLKVSKKVILTAALTVSCLGIAAVGFAEAKAFEVENILKGSYTHTMRNEFFIRNANLYNAYNPSNSWGEVIAMEESGRDGSKITTWMIGDVKRTADNFVLNVKRQVTQKADASGNINMNKIEDVNYTIRLYHRMEAGVKLERIRSGKGSSVDIDGEYVTTNEYPLMSSEAALYVLQRYMNSVPKYKNMMMGAGFMHMGQPTEGSHAFKLLEQHPTHVVTRGEFHVTAAGTILEYDVVMDRWNELVH